VVRPEDVETHYDLGIAYKEMGLMDEAISEFEIALRGAEGKPKEADCLGLLGACRAAKGEYAKALAAFGRAVKLKTLRPEGRLNLYFEIGSAREASGDLAGALEAYAQVAKVDPEYRDVTEAVTRLSRRAVHHAPLDPDLPLDEAEPTLVGVRSGPVGKVASK
jgi:tetratricopeptide (TPR) repeat protein